MMKCCPHLLTRSPAVSKLALKYSKSTTTTPASGGLVAVAVVLPLHQQQQRLSSEWAGKLLNNPARFWMSFS